MTIKRSIIVNPLWDTTDMNKQANLLQKIIAHNLFSVVEIWDTLDECILELLEKHSKWVEFDVSLSPLMNKQGYVYCTAETSELVLEYIKQRMFFLSSIGIKNISLSSPNVNLYDARENQIKAFADVLKGVCQIAEAYDISVGFEVFDIFEDKKRLLGTTTELYKLFEQLNCKNLNLTWDLGHVCLNHEDYFKSLQVLNRFIKRIHISNYSIDKNVWYFGDKHLPFENYGNISHNDIIRIIRYIKKNTSNVSLAFEVSSSNLIDELRSFEQTYEYVCSLIKQYLCV